MKYTRVRLVVHNDRWCFLWATHGDVVLVSTVLVSRALDTVFCVICLGSVLAGLGLEWSSWTFFQDRGMYLKLCYHRHKCTGPPTSTSITADEQSNTTDNHDLLYLVQCRQCKIDKEDVSNLSDLHQWQCTLFASIIYHNFFVNNSSWLAAPHRLHSRLHSRRLHSRSSSLYLIHRTLSSHVFKV